MSITDAKIQAGSVITCSRSRFGATNTETDKAYAIVLTPAERQINRLVDAVPLTEELPKNRDVFHIRLNHDRLGKENKTGEWFVLCDRMTRLSLDSADIEFARAKKSDSEMRNSDPKFYIVGDELKSIRFAMVHQLFPKSDLRVYFRSGLPSFRALTKRLVLTKWKRPKSR